MATVGRLQVAETLAHLEDILIENHGDDVTTIADDAQEHYQAFSLLGDNLANWSATIFAATYRFLVVNSRILRERRLANSGKLTGVCLRRLPDRDVYRPDQHI